MSLIVTHTICRTWAPIVGLLLACTGGELPSAGSDAASPDGLLPKAEIGALRFLEKHPEYDGRGVVIAIMDTGVDPGALGLQTTPDGRPKISDLIDGSGSGDVDTSTVVEAFDGTVKGLSGRTLRLGSSWKNPTGKYHIGLKPGYDLYPSDLIDRMQRRKRELWDEHQRPLEARLQEALIQWKAVHPAPTEAEKREQKDLEARLEQLRDLDQGFEDPGPTFDCVVFHDGDVWRAVVDTDEDGDLAEEVLLTNYRAERRYGTIGGEELLNFTVNIFQDGNLLSIVTTSGAHGTHVAGIATAYFPDQPDLNGVAPGAQVVSIKNGPNRLRGGNMETGDAIVRGLAAIRDLKCDILSASFGEPSDRPNQGRLIEMFSELVHEDGVIFVAAAHNLGPGLSTVAAPGGNSSAAIGVGAYHSPAMMERTGAIEGLPEKLFEFSSRGPTTDGAWGVSVCAPGSAFSPLPNWSLGRHGWMAGTSMATPNMSGAIALVLSGLKAEKRGYSPWSIRRALENSARTVPGVDVFGQGRGLVQVDAAFELSRRLAESNAGQPRLELVTLFTDKPGRGVYLREPDQTRRLFEAFAWVKPVFPKATASRSKLAYEARFRLEPTAPWVRSAKSMFLSHGAEAFSGGGFDLRVDPTSLATGVHWAEILGYEEGHEDLGPAFRVPITVIRPIRFEPGMPAIWRENIRLAPGGIERRFLAVPAGATWADLRLRSTGEGPARNINAQAVQLVSGRKPRRPLVRWFSPQPGQEEIAQFPVTGDRTLEFLVAHGGTATGSPAQLEAVLEFRGVVPGIRETFFDGAARVVRAEVTGALRPTRIEPKASLTARRRTLLPSTVDCRPLDPSRDQLPGGRQVHRLILSYALTMDKPAAVIPRFPALEARLYDGEFESQYWMLFDEAKRLVAVGDCTWKNSPVQLDKGSHTLRIQIRHDRLDWLEKLKSLPLLLDQTLATELALKPFVDPDGPFTGGVAGPGRGPFESWSIAPGDSAIYFLSAPDSAQLAKAGKPGDLLVGTIRYEPEPCPVSYPLSFLIAPPDPSVPDSPTKSPDDRKLEDRLADERRDFEIAQLSQLSGETNAALFEARYADLLARYPDHTPLLVAKLEHFDDADRTPARLRAVVTAADEVVRRIDTEALADHFGKRPNGESPTARKTHLEMEKQRDRLIDVLHRKTKALARLGQIVRTHDGQATKEVDAEFSQALTELRHWVDTDTDTDAEGYAEVRLHDLEIHGRFGEQLKLQRARVEAKPTDRELREQEIRVLERLGWNRWAAHEKQWLLQRFPKDYPLF